MQPPKVLELYLEITRYPILGKMIRERMREEMFSRHVVEPEVFEQEVIEKAIQSQRLEGLQSPFEQEPPDIWQQRVQQIRDNLTDFYFAYNLPHSLFEDIVQSLLTQRLPDREVVLTFNPELAPWDLLFAKGEEYENYPPEERAKIKHHLEEIVVVLIKGMISDQLAFVGIAKNFFSIADLKQIRSHRIGRGRIGGKAAGLLLAHKIIQQAIANGEITLNSPLVVPDSFFIGADVFYDFNMINDLHDFHNQKYKSPDEIMSEYPHVVESIVNSRFPEEVIDGLRRILDEIGPSPIIVRSSSLLEDSFGSAFAGKYDSFFCPNQGSPQENLEDLSHAVKRVYASVYNASAMLYRQHKGLVDYDERMAILIQKVVGHNSGPYYFPTLAGVAYSRNPFRWNRKIRREDGFIRMVWGMGTRAVDRMSNDYPRMVALSHPELRPEKGVQEIRKYSQHFVDVVDLSENKFKSLPVEDVLSLDSQGIRLLASQDQGDYIQPIFSLGVNIDPRSLVLTFEGLVQDKRFMSDMKSILKTLERYYQYPVDVEFAADISSNGRRGEYRIHLLQCRPLTSQDWVEGPPIPTDVPTEAQIFSAHGMVHPGVVRNIRYVVYVDPDAYGRIVDQSVKLEIARVIGRLNKNLEGQIFILLGPGRWGSSNIDLGVKVTYADIFNTRMLVEIAMERDGETPEVSYGTHFFQDLVESNIYPLPLYPCAPESTFNAAFFESAPNLLADLLPEDEPYSDYVKVIDIPAFEEGRLLDVVMNAEQNEALAYLKQPEEDRLTDLSTSSFP